MAPHTRIGAAHPVELGASGEVEKTDDVMKKKMENDTASFAQSIADKRHRNVDWAKSAVLDSASITAEEALDKTSLISSPQTMPDLLKQLDGREVNGKMLNTANATVVEIPMNPFGTFFAIVPAAGSHVYPDADGDLRHHRRVEQSGRDFAGRGRGDCAGPGALHVGDPAGQRRGTGFDRAGGAVVHCGCFCADARRADRRRHHRLFSSAR